jgi:hypothetical protein
MRAMPPQLQQQPFRQGAPCRWAGCVAVRPALARGLPPRQQRRRLRARRSSGIGYRRLRRLLPCTGYGRRAAAAGGATVRTAPAQPRLLRKAGLNRVATMRATPPPSQPAVKAKETPTTDEVFDRSTIDVNNILSTFAWEQLDCPDEADFVECRESFALATLFFLCEELGDKFPKLKVQVHAGCMRSKSLSDQHGSPARSAE